MKVISLKAVAVPVMSLVTLGRAMKQVNFSPLNSSWRWQFSI
jgi:hypothetical protein